MCRYMSPYLINNINLFFKSLNVIATVVLFHLFRELEVGAGNDITPEWTVFNKSENYMALADNALQRYRLHTKACPQTL